MSHLIEVAAAHGWVSFAPVEQAQPDRKPVTRKQYQREYMRERRAAWVAQGLTTDGKPRKPLPPKRTRKQYLNYWKAHARTKRLKFISQGLTCVGKVRQRNSKYTKGKL